MKINKFDFFHWIYLFWSAILIFLFIPLRKIKRDGKKTVILYGHKLNGNLHAIYTYYLKSSELQKQLNCYYLTLDPHYYRDIKHKNNILFALNPFHICRVVLSDSIITSHGTHTLILLLKLSSIKFIDVWHGIPFKGFIPKDFRTQHQYDQIWVSSKFLKKIYINQFGFSGDQVIVTGYGRTDTIIRYQKKKNRHKSDLKLPTDKTIILFAPTWKHDDVNRQEIPFFANSSDFITHLSNFAEKNNAFVIFRYHLNTGDKFVQQNPNILALPYIAFPNTEKIVALSDVLITDWSSIAFDMMAFHGPIVFLNAPPPFNNGFSLTPDYRVGDIVSNYKELEKSLREVCESEEKYLLKHKNKYEEVRNKVYDNSVDGLSSARYVENLQNLI